jgi:hypothetical protein
MKLKVLLTIIFLLFLSSNCFAEYKFADNWSKTDTAWQTVFISLSVVDWAQTRWMAKQNWEWDGEYHHETNIVLGDYPSSKDVDIYMPTAMLAHTLVAMALEPEAEIFGYKINPRRIWQGVWIGVEGGATLNNFILGARMEF